MQVSAARTLSFQGQRIRKKWSKSKPGRNLIALFGQKKGTRLDEKEDLIKDKRELRADLLEKRRRHVRELRWAKNADENGSFFDKYMLLKPIGKGGFGAVYEAKLKRNSSFGPFAVKIVSKSRVSNEQNRIRHTLFIVLINEVINLLISFFLFGGR
jgi:serine/threonine protein kinase